MTSNTVKSECGSFRLGWVADNPWRLSGMCASGAEIRLLRQVRDRLTAIAALLCVVALGACVSAGVLIAWEIRVYRMGVAVEKMREAVEQLPAAPAPALRRQSKPALRR